MPTWPVRSAKARFGELLDHCVNEGPQVISRRGVAVAVLVPIEQWHRPRGDAPTLKELLLSNHARADIPIPATR